MCLHLKSPEKRDLYYSFSRTLRHNLTLSTSIINIHSLTSSPQQSKLFSSSLLLEKSEGCTCNFWDVAFHEPHLILGDDTILTSSFHEDHWITFKICVASSTKSSRGKQAIQEDTTRLNTAFIFNDKLESMKIGQSMPSSSEIVKEKRFIPRTTMLPELTQEVNSKSLFDSCVSILD